MSAEPADLPQQDKFQQLTLQALRDLGGEAERARIRDRALELGRFTTAQLDVPSPPSKPQYRNRIEYELSWALTHLGKHGAIERVRPTVWKIRSDQKE